MSATPKFRGFFSYARFDATANPELIEAFDAKLAQQVSAKLTNAEFEIWRDEKNIRTGDRFDSAIDATVRDSHVLIILLTPKWIGSTYCLRELELFLDVEKQVSAGSYIAPILARDVERQVKRFNPAQKRAFDLLSQRQTARAIAAEFLTLSKAEQFKFIDKIADDIAGMIERLRDLPTASPVSIKRKDQRPKEFDYRAQNYEKYDFLRLGEIILTRRTDSSRRKIKAQIGFFERMAVLSKHGRFQFGIRRAYLGLRGSRAGLIDQADALKIGRENVYYASPHDSAGTIAVCIDPLSTANSLGELSLPPDPGENYLTTVATVSNDAELSDLSAELCISLNPEGLYLIDESRRSTARERAFVEAIMAVAIKRASIGNEAVVDDTGELRRVLHIKEQEED